jgi:hypothetical protein
MPRLAAALLLCACATAVRSLPERAVASRDGVIGQRAHLLDRVGARTKASSSRYIVDALDELGVALAPAVRGARDGPALVVEARRRSAVVPPDHRPRPGDLAIFDDGWLLGLITAVSEDATVEFIYVRHGVVRRGLVNATLPDRRRDGRGRAVNTFVRAFSEQDPEGTKYLAAELLSGFVLADRLGP